MLKFYVYRNYATLPATAPHLAAHTDVRDKCHGFFGTTDIMSETTNSFLAYSVVWLNERLQVGSSVSRCVLIPAVAL